MGRIRGERQLTDPPKTLVISESPFGLSNGFGVTLTTFFHGWPRERLFGCYTRSGAEPAGECCRAMVHADVPGRWGRRYAVPYYLGRAPAWRGRHSAVWLRRVLGSWRPDLVYSLVHSGETLAFAAWAALELRCPLVAHVADDGLEHYRAGVSRPMGNILAQAAGRIAISEEMREEYQRRYQLSFAVLHNGAADVLFQGEGERTDDSVVVRYLGSILPEHHFDALEDIAAAVKLARQAGMPVSFEIWGGEWTQQYARQLADPPAIVYRGHVGKNEGWQLLRAASLLVVPVSFNPDRLSHVRLSLPTKLPEYLASGAPTLVYGPPGTAPVEFCRRHAVGWIQTERSVPALVDVIRALLKDPACFRAKAAEDRKVIQRGFAASVVQAKFRDLLMEALSNEP